jgi:hypothetical protein
MKSLAEASRALTHETGPIDRMNDTPRDPTLETTASERTPDQALVHRLKTAIDQRGRYAFRLDDMSAGYAAGQGVSFADARKAIEVRFEQEFGRTPHGYLDRHYADRRESAGKAAPERPMQRAKEPELER